MAIKYNSEDIFDVISGTLGQISRVLHVKICPEGKHHPGTSWESGEQKWKQKLLMWTPTLNFFEGGGTAVTLPEELWDSADWRGTSPEKDILSVPTQVRSMSQRNGWWLPTNCHTTQIRVSIYWLNYQGQDITCCCVEWTILVSSYKRESER